MPSIILISEGMPRQVFPLGKATLMVGRSRDSEIHLPSTSISREHASIVLDENGNFVVRDNGSTNGTYVNGERVSHHVLKDHDTIRFGDYLFLVNINDETIGNLETTSPRQPSHHAGKITVTKQGAHYHTVVHLKPNLVLKGKTTNITKSEVVLPPPGDMTLMLTPPVARSVVVKTVAHPDYALVSFICGLMGVIAFFPAILFGHLASEANGRARLFRRIGLGLGYTFLIFWIIAGALFWNRVSSPPSLTATDMARGLEPPLVSSAMPLLHGQVAWVPSQKALREILSPTSNIEQFSLPSSITAIDRVTALQEFRNTWQHGIMIYEPTFLGIYRDPDSPDTIRMILEDCVTNPTFWDYNSTVLPEKKPVLGPFYVPNLEHSFFFARNPRLTSKIPKFNEPEFPWRMAERGIQWSVKNLPPDLIKHNLAQLRWLAILKPALIPSPLVLHTLEGNLLNETPKDYTFNVFPTEVLAEVLYLESSNTPLAIHLNENLYTLEEARAAKGFIDSNFGNILAHRPETETDIPTTFHFVPSTQGT